MKKTLLITIILTTVLGFSACTSPLPPGSSWADKEVLVYDVIKDGVNAGELTSTIERNPADKTVNGVEYKRATSRLTIEYTNPENGDSIEIVSLLNDFSPVATHKKVTANGKNYELSASYDGKYYKYALTENGSTAEKRIKLKTPYIDNDLTYTLLRCQNLAAGIKTSLFIPDAFSGSRQSMACTSLGKETLSVPYPDGSRDVSCYKIAVTRNSTPVGGSALVYYTPDNTENTVSGSINSIHDSTKIPVKIVENNITYQIKSISVL